MTTQSALQALEVLEVVIFIFSFIVIGIGIASLVNSFRNSRGQ